MDETINRIRVENKNMMVMKLENANSFEIERRTKEKKLLHMKT